MSMKQVGLAVLHPGTPDEVWGICESQDINLEADKKEIKNGEGDTVSLLYTDTGKKKFSGTFTPLAIEGETPVESDDLVGEELEFKVKDGKNTLKIHVDSASFKRKKGDTSEFSIEGYYYPKIDGAAAASTGGQDA